MERSSAEGYVEEIPYTYGYHPDLDPARMQSALRRADLEPPEVETACELGFGQGISLAIHAVAGRAAWWGTDLLPAHVANLRALVAGTGARLEVADEPFLTFCAREDLPQFDFIGLYGVWSWVSAANREVLIRFAARRLRAGGVLYLSYNALPGWTAMLPLREAMVAHAAAQPAESPIEVRIEAAMAHVGTRVLRDAAWVEAHPGIEAEWRAIRHKGVPYLAHEFFNRDWTPMAPGDVATALAAAGLQFAAHASETPPDPSVRFRREYWLKGGLRGVGAAAPVRQDQDHEATASSRIAARAAPCKTLNDRLLGLATTASGLAWLANPASGGGIEIGHTKMLMLAGWRRGLRDPASLASTTMDVLRRSGQCLIVGGEVVWEATAVRGHLEEEARELAAVMMSRLRDQGVLD